MLLAAVAAVIAYVPVIDGVYLNGRGPYRFLVDTGAESSVVSPEVARTSGLTATYRVEVTTVTGSRLVPAAAAIVSVNGSDHRVEVLFYEPPPPGVQGILGQNILGQTSYLIDYRNRRVIIGESSVEGVRLPLRFSNGRPAVDTRPLGELVIDSGASNLVLFSSPDCVERQGSGILWTTQGRQEVSTGHLKSLRVGDAMLSNLTVAITGGRSSGGLLPTSLFASVYVNTREGYAILSPYR